ncbi:MAG TPA: sigma-54 dependent transcriptional regulator [Stellaceae bacterium]|nr:sigma-54 dependent transcriptional regulator [Stellaceae bacterium]
MADSPTVFMVGNSPAMLEVFEQVRRFAACDVPVLITGESGTGKELVARAIHERSGRAAGPYVALNCAAVPATLIASELFGYEKGSFTGATARKHGHIEHAHGGTLFLDEIGDMPIDLQGLLLRFLQEGEVLRVGGRQPIKVDVRVVAATNVRLRDAIAAGKLREDLYYRLNVLSLHLPPLRERDGDIEVLAAYFLRQIQQELGRELNGFTPAAMAAMLAYPWPGNVRELIATLRRAVVLANGPQVDVTDLRLDPPLPPPPSGPRTAPRQIRPRSASRPKPGSDGERQAILQALQDSGFNMTRTAQLLGVARATLYRMLRRNGIELAQHYLVQPPASEGES